MNEQMQQELLNRLDLLAAKLGITGAYLWEVLVRQAHVEVLSLAGLALSGLVVVGVAWAVFFRLRARVIAEHHSKDFDCNKWVSHNEKDHYGEWLFWAWVATVIGLVMAVVGASMMVTPLLNPEYWAFQELLRLMRGVL